MHWTGKIDPIAFTVFGREVAWYGIIITASMLLGLVLAIVWTKKLKLVSDDLLEMFLIAIPLAVVGARLGYVLLHADTYFVLNHKFGWSDFVNIIAVWDGGLTITVGAPAGILGGLIWAKKNKIDFLAVADTVVCVILLCQAIGRWGNFFNQELYGGKIIDPSLQFFPYGVYIARAGAWHQATFFYESVANLLGFIILYLLSRRLKVRGSGIVLYAIAYATIRSVMESLRGGTVVNSQHFYGMIVAIVIAVLSFGLLIFMIVAQKKKYGRVWFGRGIPPEMYMPAKAVTADGASSGKK